VAIPDTGVTLKVTRVAARGSRRVSLRSMRRMVAMVAGFVSLAVATIALTPANARAQGTAWNEAWVGSEWEVYARALAGRGLLRDESWSIRPFAPQTLERWADSLTSKHPWASRLSKQRASHVALLRPSLSSSYNSAFPWGMNDGPVWQGRGLNVWGTVGASLRYGILSARFEPLLAYAANQSFTLIPNAGGSPFGSALEPASIDVPQRFGTKSYGLFNPGQSYVRLDVFGLGAGFSTENVFWGPGVRQALLFDANGAGFPHLFLGTSHALGTPIGRFSGQLIYGRLEQSSWAAPSAAASRFGAGGIGVWSPPSGWLELGLARFYHRAWPANFTTHDLLTPFGSFEHDKQVFNGGEADNQLASVFGTVRATRIGLEVFGEFGKNDRNATTRDLEVEPEHNSAWLLGFLQTVNWSDSRFWTIRAEVANGRVSPIQNLGRSQTTFYDHSPLTQGHTELGQLLGTPLIEASGGADIAVDRWTSDGRIGIGVIERQMPSDLSVGMPSVRDSRSQWDLGISATRFRGASDISAAIGHVWDLNRLPGKSAGNSYVRISVRPSLHLPKH